MCVFCKIIDGEIPSYKLYEDNDFLAILDISQATIGHTLVIPKKHFENIFELDSMSCEKIFLIVKKVADALKKSLNVSDLNILNNNGTLAGQSVNHFHIHLIPRTSNDDVTFKFTHHNLLDIELSDIANKIKINIK